jgi:hypothetical protein
MDSISNNHFSTDIQTNDALDWLRINHPEQYSEIRRIFPETIKWEGSWFDTEEMGVDVEWGNWLCEHIEFTGLVTWIDGEPYVNVTDEDAKMMEEM